MFAITISKNVVTFTWRCVHQICYGCTSISSSSLSGLLLSFVLSLKLILFKIYIVTKELIKRAYIGTCVTFSIFNIYLDH